MPSFADCRLRLRMITSCTPAIVTAGASTEVGAMEPLYSESLATEVKTIGRSAVPERVMKSCSLYGR